MVERFTVKGWDDDHIEVEDQEGKWVRYSDYAELAAENERLKEKEAHRIKIIRENENLLYSNIELRRKIEARASTGAVKVSREDFAKMVYEGMSWAAMCGPTPNGTVPVWEDHGNSLGQDEARRIADLIISALSSHPRATNTVASHEKANVSDKPEIGKCGNCGTPDWGKGDVPTCDDSYCTFPYWEATKPEGQQAVACSSCGYTADPDCPICSPATATRPSEQAVAEALAVAHEALEAASDQILEDYRTWVADDKDAKPRYGQYPRYDQVNAALRVISEALTAAQEGKE